MSDEQNVHQQLDEIAHDVRKVNEIVIRLEERMIARDATLTALQTRVDAYSVRLRKVEDDRSKLAGMFAVIAVVISIAGQVVVKVLGY